MIAGVSVRNRWLALREYAKFLFHAGILTTPEYMECLNRIDGLLTGGVNYQNDHDDS
jgi:hypothetical protein